MIKLMALLFFVTTSTFASQASKDSILSLIDVGNFRGKKSFYDKSYYLMSEQEQDEYLKRHRRNFPEMKEEFFYEYSYSSGTHTYSVFYSSQDKNCFLITQPTLRLEAADRCRMETSRCTRSSESKTVECFEKQAKNACKDFNGHKDPEVSIIDKKYCEKVYKVTIEETK